LGDLKQRSSKHLTSVENVVCMIVLINVIFSFDAILGTMALTDVFWVIACVIFKHGALMIYLSSGVPQVLAKTD